MGEIKESPVQDNGSERTNQRLGEKRFTKPDWESNRFEFALFINDSPICKRSFSINGYIEQSMQTPEFKNAVDKIVELINEDLKSKSRVYTWYHATFETPDWEPEMFTDSLIDEGELVLNFVIYDNGKEVISRQWDARYYPSYVRKCIDLTNNQVKIMKDGRATIYDKEKFFGDHGSQLSGDLYILMHMLSGKENLVTTILKYFNEVCSSYGGFYEKPSDYHTIVEYKNKKIKCDENGNALYKQKTVEDANGNEVGIFDGLGNPWMVPVTEDSKETGRRYNFNIQHENSKLYSSWRKAVIDKTRKYATDFYPLTKGDTKKEKTGIVE